MFKKRTTILALFMSIVFMLALSAGAVSTAFAENSGDPVASKDENNPVKAAVTKVLQMPVGTITPTETFTFNFESQEGAPTIPTQALNFSLDTGTNPSPATKTSPGTLSEDLETGLKTVTKETDNVFANVPWPNVGTYTYKVTEKNISRTVDLNVNIKNGSAEELRCSTKSYLMTVRVDNAANGKLFVGRVTVREISGYKPETNKPILDSIKLDPTPGITTGHPSEMAFTNTYLKINGGLDPEIEGNITFELSNEIDGANADLNHLFSFEVTIYDPATITDTNIQYKAYVMNRGKVITDVANGTNAAYMDDTYGGCLEFKPGDITIVPMQPTIDPNTITVKLKHGDNLVFTDLPIGTMFRVREVKDTTEYDQFQSSYTYTRNGGEPVSTVGLGALSIGFTNNRYITEGKDLVAFTNHFGPAAKTGISGNNLLYIVLIVVVACALLAFVLIRSRKSKQNNV
ncbi:MAG: hypothetical protein FWC60_12910 [Firmicutes bacterium]|nr:hypothetical protein [Bacillota bacterium]